MKTYSLQLCNHRKQIETVDPQQNILCGRPEEESLSRDRGNGSLCILLSCFLRGRDPAAEGRVPNWNVDLQAQLTVIRIAEILTFQSRNKIKCGRDKKNLQARCEESEGMQVNVSGY